LTSRKKASPRKRANGTQEQSALRLAPAADEHLDISALETWLWDAACAIRGATDAPKFKDFILPLVFYKRLSDVFDDEFAAQVEAFGSEDVAREVIQADHTDALKTGRKPVVRFYVPHDYRWEAIRNHPADGKLGEFVTEAMREVARLNPDLQGVLNVKDYNERQSGQRTLDDDRLESLVEVISRHRLGMKNAEADILGRAYEYLLRKFAEGQGQSAGEFYTPKEVGWLMAELINPMPFSHVYDPTCGSAGLLIKSRLVFEKNHPAERSRAPKLYGQEMNAVTFAMAKMNMFLHDYTDSFFAIGDTFLKPGFGAPPGENTKGTLKRFDYVVANPMWNQDNYDEAFYEADKWNRFEHGFPPRSSADWGWAQHILASLNDTGRAAIVLDTGAVSRGSGSKSSNKEKEIRKAFIETDVVEGVVLLPENLFYNTTAPGIILLLNRNKPAESKGQILLVNASAYFAKEKPKNALTDEGITAVVDAYRKWETRQKLSRVITLDDARNADYNLSPSQFIEVSDKKQHRSLNEILKDLTLACAERERADIELASVLTRLELKGGRQ
jgi:type I restriction enzyme M protein